MAGSLISQANEARADGSKEAARALWRLAEAEAKGSTDRERVKNRLMLFGHAMIHAGFVREPDTGLPYPTCPKCGETLGRAA